jgi:hypothetical protein
MRQKIDTSKWPHGAARRKKAQGLKLGLFSLAVSINRQRC